MNRSENEKKQGLPCNVRQPLLYYQKRLAEFRFPQKTEENQIIFLPALPVKKFFSRKECVRPKGGRASEAQAPRFKKGVSLF